MVRLFINHTSHFWDEATHLYRLVPIGSFNVTPHYILKRLLTTEVYSVDTYMPEVHRDVIICICLANKII